MIKNIVIILVCLLLPVSVYATPAVTSVTGTVTHQGTVTVNGSGFGTKSPVAPAFWDNMSLYSGYTNGQCIPASGYSSCDATNPYGWAHGGGSSKLPYYRTTSRGKWASHYSNYWDSDIANDEVDLDGGSQVTGVSTSHYMYATWWVYPYSNPGTGSSNKWCRMLSSPGSWGVPGNGTVILEPGSAGSNIQVYDFTNGFLLTNYNMPSATTAAWNRIELIADGTGSYNPRITVAMNNTWAGPYNSSPAASWYITTLGGLGADFSNGEGVVLDWGEIYADNTPARVEICNASTKPTSTHCEIQIPTTTWNANQLQITVNQGSFADSSSAYLYVADSTGTFNNSGYAVTFESGGGDTTAPTITAFTMPSTASSTTVSVSSFTATDAVGVTGYCITTTNSSSGCSWSGSAPTTATGSDGANTWYAWAKDAAGNISTASTATTAITLPSTTTAHVNGHINGSLK